MLDILPDDFELDSFISNNNQVKNIPIDKLVAYHNHKFKLYVGERFDDMVESIHQNGVLNPILVQPLQNGLFEILSGHNRVECAKKVGLKEIPAVIKENLSEDEAEVYVVETNLMQRGFNDLLISEQAMVLQSRHSKLFSQGKRNDIIKELQRLEGNNTLTSDTERPKSTRNTLAKDYGLGTTTVSYLIRINYLVQDFKDMVDTLKLPLKAGVELSFISTDIQSMIYEIVSTYDIKINIRLSKDIRKFINTNANVSFDNLKEFILSKKQSPEFQPIKILINPEIYHKYFDKKTSNDEITKTIQKALDLYFKSLE